MFGWHHQLNGHEFEQALGVGSGQGSLVCCSPWGHKESDMTELTEPQVGSCPSAGSPWMRGAPRAAHWISLSLTPAVDSVSATINCSSAELFG